MTACTFLNLDLWSGFFGTLAGAIIGGLIAYFIAKIQIKSQEKEIKKQDEKQEKEIKIQQEKWIAKEKSDKDVKEIQLLWQIYFDIKSDCDKSKLWEKYEGLLNKAGSNWGTPLAEYVRDTIQFIMRDINNFFKLLQAKEHESNTSATELFLLWERVGQLLGFLFKVYGKSGYTDDKTLEYFNSANSINQKHLSNMQK